MATRQSIDDCLLHCEEAIDFAESQYKEASLQEHNNAEEFASAQQELEKAFLELEKILNYATEEQEDLLQRKRIQIQTMQNKMTLLKH
ncbi:DUF2524 family protein [Jeotgalibacillus sp. S-D1]|uniref:YtzC family protein n=1 Tax=Jeotgalibacillus sp. S-D1 TaxID=2552189 RepID=UPI0010599FBB|nr:YtzC family protein [Jeotgalibacillus sp. S-D1]TDL34891.1 DUF2524 family protein [Jeotgalibacillus sp. S-D1]